MIVNCWCRFHVCCRQTSCCLTALIFLYHSKSDDVPLYRSELYSTFQNNLSQQFLAGNGGSLCGGAPEPTTLKLALEFLDKLYQLGIYWEVAEELRKTYKGDYFYEYYGSYTLSNCLYYTFSYASAIRGYIDKNYTSYEKYDRIGKQDAAGIAKYLVGLLPKFFNTLNFLWFNVDASLYGWYSYGGGRWQYLQFDGTGPYGVALHDWLTDKNHPIGTKSGIPSSKGSPATLLPGGFQTSEVSSYYGHSITTYLKTLVYYQDGAGYVRYLLYYLTCSISSSVPALKLTEPCPAKTALLLVFIRAFCEAVNYGTFDGKAEKYHNIKTICQGLSKNLWCITADHFDSKEYLYALYPGGVGELKSRFKADKFEDYANTLRNNMTTVINCLQRLALDCKEWEPRYLQYGHYAGPFSYGFCITSQWTIELWEYHRLALPTKIKDLIGQQQTTNVGTLYALSHCLTNPQNRR